MDLFVLNNRKSDGKSPEITRLPQSSVVDRLKSFLPEIAAANATLDQQVQLSPESYDIENVSESEEHVIEMNIAVFERDDDSSSDSSESSDESDNDSPNSDASSVHSEEQEDREAERIKQQLPRIKMPMTLRKRRSQPCVEVVHSTDNDVEGTSNKQVH